MLEIIFLTSPDSIKQSIDCYGFKCSLQLITLLCLCLWTLFCFLSIIWPHPRVCVLHIFSLSSVPVCITPYPHTVIQLRQNLWTRVPRFSYSGAVRDAPTGPPLCRHAKNTCWLKSGSTVFRCVWLKSAATLWPAAGCTFCSLFLVVCRSANSANAGI